MKKNILLAVENITVQNTPSFGVTKKLLDDVSFSISRGEIISIIGPNGGGKTTLARVITGIINPNKGKIIKHLQLKIGYVPQHFYLNQLMPLKVKVFLELSPYYSNKAMSELNNLPGMKKIMDSQFTHLSGGEKQKVLMARAMLGKPQLLILDEPSQALDMAGRSHLYKIIDDYAKKETCAVILISHDLNFVMSSTDKVLCLQNHICCQGSPQEINNDPAYKEVFGDHTIKNMAIYRHNHGHSHH